MGWVNPQIRPQCAEEVKGAAKICRFCRYEFPHGSEGEPEGAMEE